MITTRAGFLTPHGKPVFFEVREGTSDWNSANACNGTNNEYDGPAGLTGWGLDVGAHLGSVAVSLLLDNPELHVIAIEAMPENVGLLTENLAINGVAARCIVLPAAAGDGTPVEIGSGSDDHHRFIGGMHSPNSPRTIPGVSLHDVLQVAGEIVWCKVDAEGAEYDFFGAATADDLRKVAFITGEHHSGFQRIVDILGATHDVTMTRGTADFGGFTAVRRG